MITKRGSCNGMMRREKKEVGQEELRELEKGLTNKRVGLKEKKKRWPETQRST